MAICYAQENTIIQPNFKMWKTHFWMWAGLNDSFSKTRVWKRENSNFIEEKFCLTIILSDQG